MASEVPQRCRSSFLDAVPIFSREFVIANDDSKEEPILNRDQLFQAATQIHGLDLPDGPTSMTALHQRPEQDDTPSPGGSTNTGGWCICWTNFGLDTSAKGYLLLGIGRGSIIMAGVYLSSSLIYLANIDAGCVDPETEEVIPGCNGKTHGFKPSALIANVAVISGLLAAIFSPVVGAIIDYTSYRRQIGIGSAVFSSLVQGAQIYTVESTWFVMSILQAIVGFVFIIQVLVAFAYLPEMARNVGGMMMNSYTKWFTFIQFLSQILFVLVITILGVALQWDTVESGQAGQVLVTVVSSLAFGWAWGYLLPDCPARRKLPEGHSLWIEGFRQNYRTLKQINRHYKKGVKWFMMAVLVAEAGITSLVPVSITFLTEELKLGGLDIGVVFMSALVGSLPGTFLGAFVTHRTSPRASWNWNMVGWCVATTSGTFAMDESRVYLAYVWAFMWGVLLGWFYPCENIYFSMSVPSGQEAEMAGFFLYMNNMLVWLPPFMVSLIVEAGGNTRWGFFSLVIFQLLSLGFMMLTAPWDEVLEESNKNVVDDDQQVVPVPAVSGSNQKLTDATPETEEGDGEGEGEEAEKR